MKIVCENCGAKYSIADEKVKGKVFKIRCKKCSESILVRGDSRTEPEPEPKPAPQAPMEDGEPETRVFDYGRGNAAGGEPIWHIVVDDQQQGPYTEAQIKEYMVSGSIAPDTLIWREGFEDWMMAQDVPDFAAAASGSPLGSGGGGPFNEQPVGGNRLFEEQPGAGGLFGGEATDSSSPFDAGGGLFGDSSGGNDVFSSTAAGNTGSGGLFGEGGGASEGGLFAASAAAPAASSGEGIFSSTREPSVEVAAPSPRVSAEQAMLTGQRNENSVLFSLANLQALAAAPARDSGTQGAGGFSGGTVPGSGEEASGLIDIRSLAGSLNTAEQNDGVDDLISMSAGGFSPALGAPVLAAQNEGMSTGLKIGIIGGAVGFLVILVVILVILLSGDDKAQTQAEAQILALQKQIEELSKNSRGGSNDDAIAALQAQLKQKKEAASQTTPENDKSGSEKDDSASNDEKDGSGKSKKTARKTSSSSSKASSSSGKSSASSSSSSSNATAEASKPAASKPKGGSSELDDLLGGSTSSRKKASSASSNSSKSSSSSSSSSSSGGAKDSLSRSDVQNGMAAVAGAVKRCGQGKGGTITMNVMIGKTGRVSSASATGAFAGTPIGSCAARAVRRARFPASQKTLNVKYPFKL